MIQWNLSMRVTPAAMKIARMMRAPRIPQNSTLCWWIAGTWKKRKMRRKTNRLSTLSESSMTYPVTNSSAGVRPCQKKMTTAKIAARAIQATLQARASRNFTVWARRWNTPRSRTSMARTKRLNKIHNSSNQRPRVRFLCVGRTHPSTALRASLSAAFDFDFIPKTHFRSWQSTDQNLKSNSKAADKNVRPTPAQAVPLVFSAPLATFPIAPHAEGLQLVGQMGFAESLFDLGVMQARAGSLRCVGEADGQGAGFDHMFPELGQVDLIERVGHGVIVEQVVGLFLVGHKSWHSFQQEIEVIGAPIGVGGENRGVKGLQGSDQSSGSIYHIAAPAQGKAGHASDAGIEDHDARNLIPLRTMSNGIGVRSHHAF